MFKGPPKVEPDRTLALVAEGDRVQVPPVVSGAWQGIPWVVSGMGVFPGFYVFADSSDAVVIPDGQVEDVIEGARAVESDDGGYRNEIAQERLPEFQKRGPRWPLKRRS